VLEPLLFKFLPCKERPRKYEREKNSRNDGKIRCTYLRESSMRMTGKVGMYLFEGRFDEKLEGWEVLEGMFNVSLERLGCT